MKNILVALVVLAPVAAFADDVRSGNFPGEAETYHGPAGLGDALS